MTDEVDVLVAGGGLAGLIAAVEARTAGASVTLVEPHNVGGRARSTDLGGATFNVGPHALYRSGEAAAAFERLGVSFTGKDPESPQFFVDERGEHLLPATVSSMLRTGGLSALDKVEMAKLFTKLPRLDLREAANISVDDWLDELLARPRVRSLAGALVRLATYGADHDIASADAAILQLQRALEANVAYLDNGWGSLVEQLASRAERDGVVIEQAEVVSVEQRDNTFTVTTTGSELLARAVVFATPPAVIDRLVSGLELTAAAGPAVKAATIDVVAGHVPEKRLVLGVDRPTYVSVHSPPAVLAPSGMSAIAGAKYLRRDDTSSADDRRSMLERDLAVLGVTQDQVIEQRYSHALVVTNGMPLAANGGLAGRPSVQQRPGLFIAGDWVGPDGLLADASAASGAAAGKAAATEACRRAGAVRG